MNDFHMAGQPLASNDVRNYTEQLEMLQQVPPSPIWMSEEVLCLKLGFVFTCGENDILSKHGTIFPDRELLTQLILKLRQGMATIGRSLLGKIDLADSAPNKLLLHFKVHGVIEQWTENGDLIQNRRRMFARYDVRRKQMTAKRSCLQIDGISFSLLSFYQKFIYLHYTEH